MTEWPGNLPGAAPSITVILPVYNGAGWITRSLSAADAAITAVPGLVADIVVVDDGSTDGTVDEVKGLVLDTPVRVISQENSGRFLARRRGLEEATGDVVLFVDTRVLLLPDALRFVVPLLSTPEHSVWTADVRIAVEGNPLARFWRAIEHVAWRRYHGDPRWLRYGIEDFDYYPKGTTAFLCPRQLMIDAYDAFEPTVADPDKINDDTALMRFIAQRLPINIAPEYGCTYHARTTMRSFMKHAHHRGAVLIDGYLHPGARFSREITIVMAASPVGAIVALRHPKLAIGGAVAGSVAAAAVVHARGADREDAAVLGALAVPFGVTYLAGMWRGVFSRWKLRLRPPVTRHDEASA